MGITHIRFIPLLRLFKGDKHTEKLHYAEMFQTIKNARQRWHCNVYGHFGIFRFLFGLYGGEGGI